jgi:hypothetical protein
MRAYDDAIGRIVACCSAVGASYRGFRDQRGRQLLEINYRNGVFTLVTQPTDSYFRALSVRQLSNVEEFDITRSEPIVDVEDDLTDLFDGLQTANIRIDYLTETDDATGLEYFDGYRTTKPLYVFDEGFGPNVFDESLAELDQLSRKAFNDTLDRLGIEIEHPEATAGSEDQPEESYGRAFH